MTKLVRLEKLTLLCTIRKLAVPAF